jgi:hypothetical protein
MKRPFPKEFAASKTSPVARNKRLQTDLLFQALAGYLPFFVTFQKELSSRFCIGEWAIIV